MDIHAFWNAVLRQDPDAIRSWFWPEARVRWHNTDEEFTLENFIRANCEYPGQWAGEVERVEEIGDLLVTVTHVYAADRSLSFHVASFFRLKEGRILSVDEYWGDDSPAPQWRQKRKLGSPIQKN